MNKLTPNPNNKDKSLYLVVNEENIMPNPKENNARNKIKTGKKNAQELGCTSPL